jgi:lysophospholipase L1-like esterase
MSRIVPRLVALSFVAFVAGPAAMLPAQDFPAPLHSLNLEDGDCVVFLGDSITHQRLYTQYVEDFFYTRYPNKRIRFHNAGVGGARAWDALQRFDRDVASYKPKYVTILLGMNDGAYQPFNQEIFDTYMKDMNEVVEKIKAAGATPVLMTPTMLDARAARMKDKDGPAQEFYNSTLAYYGTWLRDVAQQNGYGFVDMWSPLNNITINERETNPKFTLIEDAVHPGPSGQLIMAYAILDDLGLRGPVSTIRINAAGKKAKPQATGGSIDGIESTQNGIAFTWKADALPFVVPEAAAQGAELLHLGHRASREALTVSGLSPGIYELLIDDEVVGKYSAARLADGIELQENEKTPQHHQAAQVAELNKKRNDGPIGALRGEWLRFQRYARTKQEVADQPDNAKAAEQLKELEAQNDGMEERVVKAEAEAKAIEDEIFKINKPQPHRYEIRKAGAKEVAAIGRVSGRLILDGKPVGNGKVTFVSASDDLEHASTNGEGKFAMDMPTGKYRVVVYGQHIPDRFSDLEQSGLTVNVDRGSNEFDFELTSKP